MYKGNKNDMMTQVMHHKNYKKQNMFPFGELLVNQGFYLQLSILLLPQFYFYVNNLMLPPTNLTSEGLKYR